MNYSLTIGWLYPELMSTYGDRGNIFVLQKRCEWRGVSVIIKPIDFSTTKEELQKMDFIFGGGAQDRQQTILIEDLRKKKGPILKKMIDDGTPGLFVCGSPQLLGHYYMTGDGTKLEGLGIFDMVSKHFGKDKPRCIGNLIGKITNDELRMMNVHKNTIVGFENHGGRTYLNTNDKSSHFAKALRDKQNTNFKQTSKFKVQNQNSIDNSTRPFAHVIKGFGNNGEDGTEGAVYKNCIATYSHGPFLPKNPHIADFLIQKALAYKYKKDILLEPIDDTLEWHAHDFMLKRFDLL